MDFLTELRKGAAGSRPSIEVDVALAQLDALFERTRQQWQALGRTEPYWSVLTHERFRLASIEEHRSEFDSTGQHSLRALELASARSEASLPDGVCLELGCGVGRVTRFLVDRFKKVVALDVSEANLDLCAAHLLRAGRSNVDLRLLARPSDVLEAPECDFLYSVLVLQHNPPPVIKYLLSNLLQKVRHGGAAYFQVPTHIPGYGFSAAAYLNSDIAELDMHALPMPHVFSCLKEAGFELREVLMDAATGMYGSHAFYAVRSATL